MKRIGTDERRARLARRHRLAGETRAQSPVEASRALVGLHGTDPASVFLAVRARMAAVGVGDIERALYEDRSLLRILGMRRTMFVLPVGLAAVVQGSCAGSIAVQERRKLVKRLGEAGVAKDPGRWLREVEEATVASLAARGEAAAAELTQDVPGLREQVVIGPGTRNEARVAVASHVLLLLGAEGRIVRGRPRGSWTSTQYRWSSMDSWLRGGLKRWPAAPARAELVRSWLDAFGPGTAADLRWWTGWTASDVRTALAEVGPAEVDLDGVAGFVLRGDTDPVPPVDPWVALLPALDPTAMGWSGRDWFLGDHARALFDRSGNVGPTVWWNGRIVGGWAQRAGGEVVFRLLEDIGRDAAAAVEAEAARLGGWLGAARVIPRFRTPLERELAA